MAHIQQSGYLVQYGQSQGFPFLTKLLGNICGNICTGYHLTLHISEELTRTRITIRLSVDLQFTEISHYKHPETRRLREGNLYTSFHTGLPLHTPLHSLPGATSLLKRHLQGRE